MRTRPRPARGPLRRALFAPLLVIIISGAAAPALAASEPQIAFEKYTLPNGLEVILHEDHRVPMVAVDVWYKVGSKDEVVGRTGFAHLFEHMMFQGTKHIPEDKFFDFLQKAGSSNVNGSTGSDRTNYFEVIPSNQIELALWLESERMGFLLERPSFKATLDNQRDVVKNERRQRIENAPMGGVNEIQQQAMYTPDYPYYHEVIGSMVDLSAATEGDVKSFFHKWYAPNNAAIAVSGDFDRPKLKELIERYFGVIPAGPKIVRPEFPAPRVDGEKRIAMEAKIKLPQVFVAYHSAKTYVPGDYELDILASVLAGGKSSRLYKRLVYDMKIARSVTCTQQGLVLSGTFELGASPMPGHTMAEVLAVIDEEIEKVRTTPVSDKELERVKNQIESGFFRGLEPLLGRAEQLQNYNYFAGDPGFMTKHLAAYRAVDAAALQKVAADVLRKDARVIITVDPNNAAPIMGRLKK